MKEDVRKKAEETRRRIADHMQSPSDWVPEGPIISEPAKEKKYNMGYFGIKRKNYTIRNNFLSRLEHYLLGSMMNESEPLNILYKDARKDFIDLTFASFAKALTRLFKLGYVKATIEEIEPVTELSEIILLAHYGGGLSEEEINIYPKVVNYYFRATPKGEEEEGKSIYDPYYPDEEEWQAATNSISCGHAPINHR